MKRDRIDRLLVARGLAPSRTRAQALIMAGHVLVDECRVDKPGTMIGLDAIVRVRGDDNPYVSRGGLKLAGALRRFCTTPEGTHESLCISGKVAMDVGASTGGFTDCLLQTGAARVHAVDVGYGQLAWSLVQDPRVIVHDRQNIRRLSPEKIGEPIELVVMDCSFIAAAIVIPHLPRFLTSAGADAVILVKPQFELDRGRVGKGGIVRDPSDREQARARACASAVASGFTVVDSCCSEVEGRTGNREWFLWLRWGALDIDPRAPDPASVAGTPGPGLARAR